MLHFPDLLLGLQKEFTAPSPLGALVAVGDFANPGASRRIAAISKGPSAPLRSASPGLLGIFWATRRKKRDDAFPRGLSGPPLAFAGPLEPPGGPQGSRAAREKPAFRAVLTRF